MSLTGQLYFILLKAFKIRKGLLLILIVKRDHSQVLFLDLNDSSMSYVVSLLTHSIRRSIYEPPSQFSSSPPSIPPPFRNSSASSSPPSLPPPLSQREEGNTIFLPIC